MSRPPRFLVVSYPAHGHVNPALRLSDRLALLGCDVTFVTTVFAHRTIIAAAAKRALPTAVSFASFSDGFDNGYNRRIAAATGCNYNLYIEGLRCRGSNFLRELLGTGREEGRPYGCLVYTLLQSWVANAAAEFNLPTALLWVQSATVFHICHHYFHGFKHLIEENFINREHHTSASLNFPALDDLSLTADDLPTFLDQSNPEGGFVSFFEEQFEAIDKQSQRQQTKIVLVNTFDALEPQPLRALSLFGIGPLISNDNANNHSNDGGITEWLDSKPKGSVVYVSFGSVAVLEMPQMEEIAKGLLDLGRPFLWVIREIEEKLSCEEELKRVGMIVSWCRQVEVLRHGALGCFVSHCGWNSSLESMVFGVPVVAIPQFYDQVTNAKLIEDVCRVGVRVKKRLTNGNGVVGGEEIKRCLEMVLLEGEGFRRNAEKWRDLAREAMVEGGSSEMNLKAFVAEIIGESKQS